VINYSDKAIIDGIREQDRIILKYIYKSFYPSVRQLVVKNSGDENDAKDIFQETVLIVYEKIKNNKLTLQCSLKTFFYSVSKNLLFEQLRHKQKVTATVFESEDMTTEEVEMDEETQTSQNDYLFYKHFTALSEGCQKILQLLLNKVSAKQIAMKLGFASENYANKRKHQCKKDLMKRIKNDPLYKNANRYE